VSLAILLIGFRIALPHILVWYINETIEDLPEYHSRVDAIELSLLDG
jgi:hypothetical protein